jgi:uncharacterized protein (UPF0333 family)
MNPNSSKQNTKASNNAGQSSSANQTPVNNKGAWHHSGKVYGVTRITDPKQVVQKPDNFIVVKPGHLFYK